MRWPRAERRLPPARRARLGRLACAALASLFAGRTARATPVEVRATGCAGVDERQVERLLEIELTLAAAALAATAPLRVDLVCAGPRLRMAAFDPITGRQLQREVVMGPSEPGRERTIALLTSQLFLTSWAERFLARPPAPAGRPEPSAPAPAGDGAGAQAREQPPPPDRWQLLAGGGARLRDWSAPTLDGRLSVRPSVSLGGLGAFADLAYERGAATRASGTVAWSMGSAGLGAGWRSRRFGPLAVGANAALSATYIDVRGQPSSPAFVGDSVHGLAGEAALGAGPIGFWGRLRWALELEAGWLFPTATARSAGDRDVNLGGAWAGASLRLGAAARGAP